MTTRLFIGLPALTTDNLPPLTPPLTTSLATRCPLVRVEVSRKSRDRKSTRLNSSHLVISYAVFCLKKKSIQTATTRHNTKDQVNAQIEILAYQQKASTARVASIMENTNLSKQQQVSEIMRQMLTQAQTAGQYFTNDQIKEMTRKVSAEVDLVHQQTQNQRYGSSHIGATAKDISNVVTDA